LYACVADSSCLCFIVAAKEKLFQEAAVVLVLYRVDQEARCKAAMLMPVFIMIEWCYFMPVEYLRGTPGTQTVLSADWNFIIKGRGIHTLVCPIAFALLLPEGKAIAGFSIARIKTCNLKRLGRTLYT
jgi:hypothetical protein